MAKVTEPSADASNWITKYIDSGEASSAFVKCVDKNGDLFIIKELWMLIKEFMITETEMSYYQKLGYKHVRSLMTRSSLKSPLKSYLYNLKFKGKTGIHRNNIQGKRIDFSGRSVISPHIDEIISFSRKKKGK